MSSEHERIAFLKALHTSDAAGSVVVGTDGVGIGDDAAHLKTLHAPIISVDVQVEGVHFERSFADWPVLSRRATIAALSDLCAMGAQPRAVFSSLVLPSSLPEDSFREIARGIRDAAQECGAVVAGGNLSRGPCVMIDTTVVGEVNDLGPIRRDGAQPGDGIYVRGFPGAAALGLVALLSDRVQDAPAFVEAWRQPKLDVEFAKGLCGHASAAIDISDGFAQDLQQLCTASKVGAIIDIDAMPRLGSFDEACARFGVEPRALLIGGGEVYDLLFCAKANVATATRVGEIVHGSGIVDRDGRSVAGDGFDHFKAGATS